MRLVPSLHASVAGYKTTVIEDCVRAARILRFPVPCPALLPENSYADTAPSASTCPGRVLTIGPGCDSARRAAFASLEYYDPQRPGHIVIVATPRPMTAEAAINYPVKPPPASRDRVIGHVRLRGERATVLAVANSSESAFGGHTVAIWTERRHTYAVSVHGLDPGAEALTLAIGRAIRLIRAPN